MCDSNCIIFLLYIIILQDNLTAFDCLSSDSQRRRYEMHYRWNQRKSLLLLLAGSSSSSSSSASNDYWSSLSLCMEYCERYIGNEMIMCERYIGNELFIREVLSYL